MVEVVSVLVAIPLVAVGLLLALAGRDLFHSMIRLFGFLFGFGAVVVGSSPLLIEALFSEAYGELLIRLAIALLLAVGIGYLSMHLAWFVYRLSIELPGAIAGALIALFLFAPMEGIEYIALLIFFSAGGYIAWKIHEFLLVINTSLLGGVLVGIGVAGAQLWELPVVRNPERLLTDPGGVISASLVVAQVFVITVLVVFCVGLLSQWRIISIVGFLSRIPSLARIKPASTPEHSTDSADPGARTVPKARRQSESTAPSESPDDNSGFYEK